MKKREPDKVLILNEQTKELDSWSKWRPFPDPRKGEYLVAPFGQGVYELRNKRTDELVLFGQSKNVANRMTSLIPRPLGSGTRKNEGKRKYILEHLTDIEYRTLPCATVHEAKERERKLKVRNDEYLFPT